MNNHNAIWTLSEIVNISEDSRQTVVGLLSLSNRFPIHLLELVSVFVPNYQEWVLIKRGPLQTWVVDNSFYKVVGPSFVAETISDSITGVSSFCVIL